MNDDAILRRARAAGIAVDWIDASDRPQRVSTASLQRILDALHPGPPVEIPPLLTATVGEPIVIPGVDQEATGEMQLEGGPARPVTIYVSVLPAIDRPGYHTLRFGKHEITLAVAPPRCFTVGDIAPAERLWGLAVQVYSLRRPGDLGIGVDYRRERLRLRSPCLEVTEESVHRPKPGIIPRGVGKLQLPDDVSGGVYRRQTRP